MVGDQRPERSGPNRRHVLKATAALGATLVWPEAASAREEPRVREVETRDPVSTSTLLRLVRHELGIEANAVVLVADGVDATPSSRPAALLSRSTLLELGAATIAARIAADRTTVFADPWPTASIPQDEGAVASEVQALRNVLPNGTTLAVAVRAGRV